VQKLLDEVKKENMTYDQILMKIQELISNKRKEVIQNHLIAHNLKPRDLRVNQSEKIVKELDYTEANKLTATLLEKLDATLNAKLIEKNAAIERSSKEDNDSLKDTSFDNDIVTLKRNNADTPWGFTIAKPKGQDEYQVTSLSQELDLYPSDTILAINNQDLSEKTDEEVQTLLKTNNTLNLKVIQPLTQPELENSEALPSFNFNSNLIVRLQKNDDETPWPFTITKPDGQDQYQVTSLTPEFESKEDLYAFDTILAINNQDLSEKTDEEVQNLLKTNNTLNLKVIQPLTQPELNSPEDDTSVTVTLKRNNPDTPWTLSPDYPSIEKIHTSSKLLAFNDVPLAGKTAEETRSFLQTKDHTLKVKVLPYNEKSEIQTLSKPRRFKLKKGRFQRSWKFKVKKENDEFIITNAPQSGLSILSINKESTKGKTLKEVKKLLKKREVELIIQRKDDTLQQYMAATNSLSSQEDDTSSQEYMVPRNSLSSQEDDTSLQEYMVPMNSLSSQEDHTSFEQTLMVPLEKNDANTPWAFTIAKVEGQDEYQISSLSPEVENSSDLYVSDIILAINEVPLRGKTAEEVQNLLNTNNKLNLEVLLRSEEPITPMLIENPAHNKALHLTLQNNSQAHISHLQKAFTDGTLSYQKDQVYVNTQLSSIGETVLVRIPDLGYRAIPFIINLDEMNIPIFKRVLIAYEKERARLRNQYIITHDGDRDYQSFLQDLASQHPDSSVTPEELYQALSWQAGFSNLTIEDLNHFSEVELPRLFDTIVTDIEDISPQAINALLESAKLKNAIFDNKPTQIKRLLSYRKQLIKDMAQQAILIIRGNTETPTATFADAYAQLEKIRGKRPLQAFFESKAAQISA
jgi:hypothetical protein